MARLLPVLAMMMLSGSAWAAGDPPADVVLRHGRIHTQDPARSVAESLAVRGNTLVFVGSDEAVAPLIGPHTTVVDLAGKTVLPGLIDAHIHPAESAPDMDKCSLDDKMISAKDLVIEVRECLKHAPGDPKSWFEVVQVNPSGLVATLADLDAILADRPLLMSGSDGHTAWANSAALERAGITAATKDPPGGRIERDANGNPTGTLRDNAIDLATAKRPEPSLDYKADQLNKAFDLMRADGLTSVQDARVNAGLMAVYKKLYDQHRLRMRVRGCYHYADLKKPAETLVAEAIAFRKQWAIDPDYLRADSVKIFADGVIEYPSQTAALLEPYLDADGHPTTNVGPSYFTQDNLNKMIALTDAADLTVHVHAIGDRAIRSALDAFAYARKVNGMRDNRDQIAHLQLVEPEDVPRFKELGVIANFQLQWAERDDYIEHATIAYLGPERSKHLYPAGDLKKAGAFIVGGSDWNVSTFNPFEAMEHGITRRMDKTKPPLLPEQALTLQDMVDAYTINAAFALKQERTTGSLEPGKRGDFVVLDRDIFAIDPYDLHAVQVLSTYLDGKPVFQREQTK